MEQHSLYLITNKTNGRQYVGVSKNPESRFEEHMCGETNPLLMQDRALGHQFSLSIIKEGGKQEIYALEELTINKLNTRYPFGYNLALGGCGGDTGFARKGSECTNAKINESDALAIREKRHKGESYSALAREYGLSHITVRKICVGESWKHVSGPLDTKRTLEDIADMRKIMREMRKSGMSYAAIGREFGLTGSGVKYHCSVGENQ